MGYKLITTITTKSEETSGKPMLGCQHVFAGPNQFFNENILLMVQKSQDQPPPPGMVLKPVVNKGDVCVTHLVSRISTTSKV